MANVRFARVVARLLVLGGLCALLVVQPLTLPAAMATGGRVEQEPSAADLARQQGRLVQLQAAETQQAGDVEHAQAALLASSALAGQALEASSLAVRALQSSQVTEGRAQDLLDRAQQTATDSQRDLGRWARQAYQGGSGLAADPTLNTLLQARNAADIGLDLVVIGRVGRVRQRTLANFERAQQRASAAADAAASSSDVAAAAAIKAAAAHQAADQAVDQQRQLLGIAQTSLAQTRHQSAAELRRQAEMQAAAALAQSAHAASSGTSSSAGSGDNQVTGQVGECSGGDDVQQYPNGQIPKAALCPLVSAPGQYLRADAAFAFDRLSQDYAATFGGQICITDSYRSLASQVDLFARKPGLAAHPGTSNHGWGTAVDLCGGIQNFGTAEHQWMLLNAPLYGWFHPGWAEPSGSRPEPWHWEFGG